MANSLAVRVAPVVADVAGWTSLGCFLDNVAPHRLLGTSNFVSFVSNALTPGECGSFCAESDYTYFGLEHSTTCYCANTLNNTPCSSPGWPFSCGGQPAYPMECTSPCSGDSSYQCGNALVLNLYVSTKSPVPVVRRQELQSSSSTYSAALTSNTGSAIPETGMATTSTSYPGTTSASASSDVHSTSTIYETQFITITSCAPTITHCPARNTSMSMVSKAVAIVIYSTECITISSCAPAVTNCPYSVSTRMVPVVTVTLHGNPSSPTPMGSTMMPTAIPTPGNGGVVPSNGTTPSNTPIVIVSGTTGNGLVWSSFVAVGFVFIGMFWA